jgi:ABC-type phosphate/phosphonate transport system ATPase subunit
VAPLIGAAPGRTRVLVTHDVDAALDQADRVLGLRRDGTVAFELAAAGIGADRAREIYSERAGAVA